MSIVSLLKIKKKKPLSKIKTLRLTHLKMIQIKRNKQKVVTAVAMATNIPKIWEMTLQMIVGLRVMVMTSHVVQRLITITLPQPTILMINWIIQELVNAVAMELTTPLMIETIHQMIAGLRAMAMINHAALNRRNYHLIVTAVAMEQTIPLMIEIVLQMIVGSQIMVMISHVVQVPQIPRIPLRMM